MWTAVSGLMVHGEKMNVVGNNISNVNTVGFKAQRMDFQDFVYQYVGTASGMGQVGRGTNIGIVMNDFSQAAFETTTDATDIGISGTGFFCVKPKSNNTNYYTRAGNFRFDKDGYLVDPHGYVLQGWEIDPNSSVGKGTGAGTSSILGTGTPVDIKLDTFTCPPRHTTNVKMQVNLSSIVAGNDLSSTDTSVDPNCFFALLNTWDATQTPPLGKTKYAYQSTMEVYDEAGKLHKLSVYFDRVTNSTEQQITDNSTSESYWEYTITMDPADDFRDFSSSVGDVSTNPDVPDKLKGLLAAGTFTFDSAGQMKDMTCFVPQTNGAAIDTATPGTSDPSRWWTGTYTAGTGWSNVKADLSQWVAAPISSSGFPMITPNFSGSAGLSNSYYPGGGTGGPADYTQPNVNADGRMIAMNFGMYSGTDEWNFDYAGTGPGGLVRASQVSNDKTNIAGLRTVAKVEPSGITNVAEEFYERFPAQDGYTFGELRYVQVSEDGVLSGAYSNGVTLELYQITLYDFPSKQNLRREGGNLFTETRDSGQPASGAAGSGVFGTTQGNSLEQSNVDLSREFVNMITTQRGFQANSKAITTVDTMLETVIGMKR